MHKSYGAIFASVISHLYLFFDGCCLFMSDKNRAKVLDADIVTKEGATAKQNFVIDFDRFIEDHT